MRCVLLSLLLSLVTFSPLTAQTYLGKSYNKWVSDLSDKDPAVRRGATYALGKLDSAEAAKPLAERLKDDDLTVREGAAGGLGDLAERNAGRVWIEAGTELRHLLTDKEPRVRRAAAVALGRCRELAAEAAPDLRKLLNDDESPMVRQNAAWALGRIKGDKPDSQSVTTLVSASKRTDEDPYVLREVANALAAQVADNTEDRPDAVNEAVTALFDLLKREPDRLVVKPTLQALQKTATRKQAEQAMVVEKYLDDKDADMRKAAAFTLANAAGPKGGKAMKVLLEVLLQGNEKEQEAAAASLAGLGEAATAAVNDLARVLEDTKRPIETRLMAVFAISRIRKGIDPIVPILVKVTDAKEDARIRELAAEALGALNFSEQFKNKDLASEALVRLLKEDAAPRVRQRALWALYTVPNLKAYGALEPMVAIVKDKESDRILRYDTARVLALRLREETVDEAIDNLVEMLGDEKISVYVPAETRGSGGGSESSTGGTTKVVQTKGGDARFMAAQALGAVGPRVKQRQPKAIELLKKLKESKDPMCVKAADEALKSIGG